MVGVKGRHARDISAYLDQLPDSSLFAIVRHNIVKTSSSLIIASRLINDRLVALRQPFNEPTALSIYRFGCGFVQ